MESHENNIIAGIQEQFGAAFEMLKIALEQCPNEIWAETTLGPPFWQVAHHVLYYVDWYLSLSTVERENFVIEFPDISTSLDPTNLTIERSDLLRYLQKIAQKARSQFDTLTPELLQSLSVFEWHGETIFSSLLYNLRHLMLHIGTLNYRILRGGIKLDNWICHKTISKEENGN